MSVSPTGREEGDIQAILQDSGFEEDTDLRRSLEDLRAFALDGPPEPRADLQALLSPGVTSLDLRRRNRQRRMGIVVGAAVVGAMGLGAGAVAASSEDFRQSVGHTVVRFFQPADEATAPKTDIGSPSPAGLPVLPAPAAGSPAPSPTTAAQSPTTSPATPAARVTPAHSSGAASGEKPDKAAAARALPTQLPVVPGKGTHPQLPSKPQPVVPTLPGAVPAPSPGKP
jgi:hypothetical protein